MIALHQKNFAKEPKKNFCLIAPILDRLTDVEQNKSFDDVSKKYHFEKDVIHSVQNEIYTILSTRSFCSCESFGVKDFESIDGANKTNWPFIALIFKKSITKLEPRIKKVVVEVVDYKNSMISIKVKGEIMLGEYITGVIFSMSF